MQRLSKFKDKAFLACLKADWLNTCANWLNGMKIIGGEVLHTPDGIIINPFMSGAGGGSGPDYSPFCFGFKIVGETVTVTAGEVQWGESVFGIGTTDLPITSDLLYIGLEATYDGAILIGPDSNLSAFRSTADVKRTWLYQFNWVPGESSSESPTVTLRRIGKPLGNWIIDSEFSPQ